MLRHDGLLNRIIEGRSEGKRGRGRKRQQMIDDIMDKEKYGNLKRTAVDRMRWIGRRIQLTDFKAKNLLLLSRLLQEERRASN